MCIRDRQYIGADDFAAGSNDREPIPIAIEGHSEVSLLSLHCRGQIHQICLLYTSDAADERSSVDLGGRRILKKKTEKKKNK